MTFRTLYPCSLFYNSTAIHYRFFLGVEENQAGNLVDKNTVVCLHALSLFHGMAPISCLFSLPCLKPHQPQ